MNDCGDVMNTTSCSMIMDFINMVLLNRVKVRVGRYKKQIYNVGVKRIITKLITNAIL